MAKSASTVYGFSLERSLSGVENPASLDYIIKASTTISIGDPVRVDTTGYLVRSAAGEPVLGICVGLVDKDGLNVFSPQAQGTTGATLTPDDTIAVSSTNVTDTTRNLKAQVVLDPAGALIWKNTASAALSIDHLMSMFDVGSTVGQISHATASVANGQFQLVDFDRTTTTTGYFRINESQFATGLDSATSKVT